jgi:hypothetical protein
MEKRPDAKETPTEANARGIEEIKSFLVTELKKIEISIQQLYANQEAMKAGLDSAEANLRAFQKVINATVAGNVALVPPAKEGDPAVINWEGYYRLVDAELKALAAAAKEAELARVLDAVSGLKDGTKLAWLKERVMGHIAGEPVDATVMSVRMQNASKFFEMIEAEVTKAVEGKEFSTEKIDNICRMILIEEKNEATEKEMERQGVAPSTVGHLADEPSEEEVVFGGDSETKNAEE